MITFVSYSGGYPALCCGTLVLNINGKEINTIKLVSGGYCSLRETKDCVIQGAWSITNVPNEYKSLEDEIVKVVNHNVPFGCCGGCI